MSKKSSLDETQLVNYDGGPIYMDPDKTEPDPLEGMCEENILFLPLDDEVFFPYMQIGTLLEHPDSIATARKALKSKEKVFLFLASDSMPADSQETQQEDIMFSRGCVGIINNLEDIPDGKVAITAIIGPRAIAVNLKRRTPYMRGDVVFSFPGHIDPSVEEEKEIESRLDSVYGEIANHLSEQDRERLKEMYNSFNQGSIRQLYFMMQNSPLNADQRYQLLEINDLSSQRRQFTEMLEGEKRHLEIRSEIHQKTMSEMGQRQRDEYLRLQMQQIKNELGETDDDDIEALRQRANDKEWTEETRARFDKELRKLQRFNPTTVDYSIQYAYIDEFLSLPWLHCDNADFTLDYVRKTLDNDHYGLEKVKERIVEQMAVLKLRHDTKAPILCLYGPPGVGKTSLGKSVASALGRKYVRVALGGLHDEAEIRGHRRTYLGSMPGRIITALQKCGTSDPVMVLDEIDKIGADYKGDPSQALLEVLDPEQNCKFHDNYIDQDYDLSKVLFIATANSLSTISSPLLDRMELFEIGGYAEAEKVRIAQRHLIPKNLTEHGFAEDEIAFTDEALMEIITSHTRESGVRRLEKKINDVLRKLACLKASDKEYPRIIDVESAKEYLGKPETFSDVYENNDIPGVVTGLAWTQAGGEILFIESSIAPGKEGKLVLTGNLGDVMKESAMLALQYIKANHEALGIPQSALEFGTAHVHVPEGAVPKDGPSAGVTIVTSLASTFTGRKVRSHLAMTGEITLRGKVLPVGGIKEKILAAKRAGIKTVMLCEKNRKDIEEIKPEYIEGLDFHFVESVAEALEFALLP